MSTATGSAPAPGGARPRPSYRARIERIFDHAEDTRSLFLRMVEGERPHHLPGMFISVSIPLANETRIRPYTIASSPEDGEPFEICFNRVPGGAGAAWLFARIAGDVLEFTGPFGAFTLERAIDRELVFIAEGTAIAAIRPMIRRVLAQKPAYPVRLLYAADRGDHILYRGEIEAWAAVNSEFKCETVIAGPEREALYARIMEETERRWVGADGDRSRHFYVCGVGPGVLRIRDLLRGAGYERRAVHYEQW
jgi:ferredoxin-NADP reductase